MKTGRPLLLSASRRTDLPGFHAESCVQRIRDRIRRTRTRPLAGVVFWSKHVDPFLPSGPLHTLVRSELENPVLNLTITGFGQTPIEPCAPALHGVLERLPDLVEAFHGEPWRIRWRFDPLLKGLSSLETFGEIAASVSSLGIPTCTFSFPAYRSLKGDLTKQFEDAGVERWQRQEQQAFLSQMLRIASPLGIQLLSCAQPENASLGEGVGLAQCIPVDVLKRGFPLDRLEVLKKDWSQRTHCTCIESEDIGDYVSDPCGGGCVYCYSKAGPEAP